MKGFGAAPVKLGVVLAAKLGVVLAAKFGDAPTEKLGVDPAAKFGDAPAPKFGLAPFMPVMYDDGARLCCPGIDIGAELEICKGSVALTVGA